MYQRLKKKHEPWTQEHTKIVQHIKEKVKYLPCLNIPQPNAHILSIVLSIKKFEDDLYMKPFLLRIDCKSAKPILENDVKNIISKQIFARWQALLSNFDFEIEFIKGENNSLPDFL